MNVYLLHLRICIADSGGHSLAGTAASNPDGGMDVRLLSVVCYQVEVSAR